MPRTMNINFVNTMFNLLLIVRDNPIREQIRLESVTRATHWDSAVCGVTSVERTREDLEDCFTLRNES
jgi:hypothetical protein